jgi:hypothetical protein
MSTFHDQCDKYITDLRKSLLHQLSNIPAKSIIEMNDCINDTKALMIFSSIVPIVGPLFISTSVNIACSIDAKKIMENCNLITDINEYYTLRHHFEGKVPLPSDHYLTMAAASGNAVDPKKYYKYRDSGGFCQWGLFGRVRGFSSILDFKKAVGIT